MSATLIAGSASLGRSFSDDLASPPTRAGDDSANTAARTVDSKALLQGQKAVSITHNGSVYRLQSTRLGKLILTK